VSPVTSSQHVAAVLGVTSTADFEQDYRSAEAVVAKTCRWPSVDAEGMPLNPPEDLVQAVVLRTARYLARRNSPTGVVGVGEFGPVRITSVDRDIEELEQPWRMVVFG